MALLLLIIGGFLAFAAIGWLSRRPGIAGGKWRLPAGIVAIAVLFAGVMLSARGLWIAGAPLVLVSVLIGLLARSRTEVPRQVRDRMSETEARAVLGVEPGATAAEIRAAHARLIRMAHPDAGGTHGLAAQLNAARDRLLGSR